MEKKFKETSIPEDYSKSLATQQILLGPQNAYRIATVLFDGVSSCLGAMKNPTVPKAVVFKSLDGSFLAGAKVEYVGNADDPTNPAAGNWDYTWTFYEEDLKGADCIDAVVNSLVTTYFTSSGIRLYNMKIQSPEICNSMMVLMIEMIIGWLKENATDSEAAVLTLEGVFKATGEVEDGKTVIGIVPAGEMKVLIKDDSVIQEN